MTAIEYCNLYGYEQDKILAWTDRCVGLIFTKFDRRDRSIRRRFLPREQCVTAFDISRFVTKYNMENWSMEGVGGHCRIDD